MHCRALQENKKIQKDGQDEGNVDNVLTFISILKANTNGSEKINRFIESNVHVCTVYIKISHFIA